MMTKELQNEAGKGLVREENTKKRAVTITKIKWTVSLCLILIAAIYFIPFPIKIVREYKGAEYKKGIFVQEVRISLTVWKLSYLLKENEIKGEMLLQYDDGWETKAMIDTRDLIVPGRGDHVLQAYEIRYDKIRSMDLRWLMESDRVLIIYVDHDSADYRGYIFCTNDEEFGDVAIYREMYNKTKNSSAPDFEDLFFE